MSKFDTKQAIQDVDNYNTSREQLQATLLSALDSVKAKTPDYLSSLSPFTAPEELSVVQTHQGGTITTAIAAINQWSLAERQFWAGMLQTVVDGIDVVTE